MVRLDAGIPDPRPRQLRDAQQSCRYPTREYQLDRPSLKMAPPRSLSGASIAIHPPRTVGRTNSSPLTKKAISTFDMRGRPRPQAEGGSLDGRVRPHSQRRSLRTTSLRPDQTSLTAHTLTSTNPSGNATSRIVSSVMVVGTFAAFLGQDTHTVALGLSVCRRTARRLTRSSFFVTKMCAMSTLWPA